MSGIRKRPRGQDIRPSIWENYKEVILQLYITEGKTLKEVCGIMKAQHGFDATQRRDKSKFNKWGIRKYRRDESRPEMCPNTPTPSVEHTPDPSRNTSVSQPTPESSGNDDVVFMQSPLPRGSNLFGNERDMEPRLSPARRSPRISRTISNFQREAFHDGDHQLVDKILAQVRNLSSPPKSSAPSSFSDFQSSMTAPFGGRVASLKGEIYPSDKFRGDLLRMIRANQEANTSSPQPLHWTYYCFMVNFLLGQGKLEEAKINMLRAARTYLRLIETSNEELLSIISIVLSNLFICKKHDLAAELLAQAKTAASFCLYPNDPIITLISFAIAEAQKGSRGFKIANLRHAAENLRERLGFNHQICIVTDYKLAWRLAMEPESLEEALSLLQETQVRAEQYLGHDHLQTVAFITTRARVLSSLGQHSQAVQTMSEALRRIMMWKITDDYPYYVQAKKSLKVILKKAGHRDHDDNSPLRSTRNRVLAPESMLLSAGGCLSLRGRRGEIALR